MPGDVEVEHVLAEGALHSGEAALEDGEAGAGHAGGGLEQHLAEGLAEVEMLAGSEVGPARLADLFDDDVGGVVVPVRDAGVEDVGKHGQPLTHCLIERGRTLLQRHLGVAETGGFALRRCCVLALPLPGSDLLGEDVAPGLAGLRLHQCGAALRVQGEGFLGGRRQTAPGQGGVERVRVGADGTDVVHQASTGLVSTIPAVTIEIS